MIGQTISHYRILAELGVGGMGVVYRAEDSQLGREVAVKFLPAEFSGQGDALARFQREARLASALNHPHICTVHDIGDHHGRPYIVMELLEGRTLRQLISEGALPTDRVLDLAMQITEALDAAHHRGIIHRDIKPANVFVTRNGQAKVLDFGLAKLVSEHWPTLAAGDGSSSTRAVVPDDELTGPGIQVGTMAYMPPEQARGQAVDARSDLFSLGAVLYEMATGMRAFPGPTPALVLDGVLNRSPLSPRYVNPGVPAELERIIERTMEKEPSLRYQSAADVLSDLRRLKRGIEDGRVATTLVTPVPVEPIPQLPSPRVNRRSKWIGIVLGGLVLAILAISGVTYVGNRAPGLTDKDSILLAEFANSTGDPVFDGTLSQALAVQLSQSPFLDIVPEQRVGETLALMGRPRETRLTHEIAGEVCQRLGIRAMLEGSITSLGNLYVVALNATNCQTKESIAREQTEAGRKEQVLRALGLATSSIRAKLGESLPMLEQFDVPIERATTPSLEALKAYTLGMRQRALGAEVESIPFLQRAIELDPDFAVAYNTLSTVYGNLGEWSRSEEHARLAYARRDRVSERERLFITYQFHDRVTGDQLQTAETLEVWKQAYPRDFTPANALALVYTRLGRYDRGVEEGREAVRRNPTHPFPLSNLAHAFRGLNQFDEAKKVANQAVALKIETTPTRRLLYHIALIEGDEAGARQHLDWARNKPREFDMIAAEAQVAAFSGRMNRARELFRRSSEMAAQRGLAEAAKGVVSQEAWTEALYGNLDAAADRLRMVMSGDAAEDPSSLTQRYRVAATLAMAGAIDDAQRMIDEAASRQPESTLLKTVLVPVTRAAVALRRRQPQAALDSLQAASPNELGTVAAFSPIYFRGLAALEKGSGAEAANHFQQILDHRGTDPFSPLYALARLGLARAQALGGASDLAIKSYEDFLALWSGADPDLPVFRQAIAEHAKLTAAQRPALSQ